MYANELYEIWEEGNNELLKNNKITRDMITQYLDKQTIKTSRYFSFNIVFFSLIQLINVILCSMNIVAYNNNMLFQIVLIAMLILSSGILIYGINLFVKFREIINFSDSLNNLINKQLHFIKVQYEIWLVIISLSILILIFNINIIVDYDGGYYPIHNKLLYVIINVCLFAFIYAAQKMSSSRLLAALKAYLTDLKKGGIEESLRIEESKRKQKWIMIGLVILFTLSAIAGFLKMAGLY